MRGTRHLAERSLALGWPAWGMPVLLFLHIAATSAIWILREVLPYAIAARLSGPIFGPASIVALGGAWLAWRRIAICAPEVPGLLRIRLAIFAIIGNTFSQALIFFIEGIEKRHFEHFDEWNFDWPNKGRLQLWFELLESVLSDRGLAWIAYFAVACFLGFLLFEVLIAFSSFSLIPRKARNVFWNISDVVITALFVFALWALPFTPAPDQKDITLPAIALSIAALFALRASVRFLPHVFNRLENGPFELMVASRMLRAKKSGFLTLIGGLSILAVSFSSCTLVTTLSVMGGFRSDLQKKIIGHHAHVLIDRSYGTFPNWKAIAEKVSKLPGVLGTSPFLRGEVMITSATESPSAAELRGIIPEAFAKTSSLPQCLRSGSLSELEHPLNSKVQKQLHKSFFKIDAQEKDASIQNDEKKAKIMKEVEHLIGEAQESELPGLLIGQELARSLRIHVGDEVTVIAPSGELGPTGLVPRIRPFRIAGVFYTGMFEYDMKSAYTLLPVAQELFQTGDEASGIE
ncbi:MAG: hypothetical protein N2515_03010, partial [Deltaproteobacteria bacterium]|nr:hypothetical protein [Deltaproteobacteria bacterium]